MAYLILKNKKSAMLEGKRGLSIIELLITILLITVTVGAGLANYRRLNARKQVEDAAKQLEQAIRDTQKRATSGVKPAGGCANPLSLKVYRIEIGGALGARHYRISQVCSDNSVNTGTTVEIARNIIINSGATIDFDLLGRTSADTSVCIRNPHNEYFYRILINSGGSVNFSKAASC